MGRIKNIYKIFLCMIVTFSFIMSFPMFQVHAQESRTYTIKYKTGVSSTAIETYTFTTYNEDLTCFTGIGYNKLVPFYFVSTEPFSGQRNNRYTVNADYDETNNLYYYYQQPTGYLSNASNIVTYTDNVIYDETFRYNDNYSLRQQAFDRFNNLYPEESSTEPGTEEPSTEPSTEEPSTEPSTENPSVEPSYDLTEEQENLKDSTTNYLYTFLQVFMINGFILATLLSFIGYGVFKAFSLLNIHNRT